MQQISKAYEDLKRKYQEQTNELKFVQNELTRGENAINSQTETASSSNSSFQPNQDRTNETLTDKSAGKSTTQPAEIAQINDSIRPTVKLEPLKVIIINNCQKF